MKSTITIRESLFLCITESIERRLKSLIKMKAPEIMIEREKEILVKALKGNIKIGGDNSLLDLHYDSIKKLTGRSGKPFYEIQTTERVVVNYFPQAKFGRFIAVKKSEQ